VAVALSALCLVTFTSEVLAQMPEHGLIELAQGRQGVRPPAERRSWGEPARRRAEDICPFPWSYSRGLRRCVCVRQGYSLQRGVCAPQAAQTCGPNERWSPRTGACVCTKGMRRQAGVCVAREESRDSVAEAQKCLIELGYLEGPAEERMGDASWTAFWHFKHENGLVACSDPLAGPVQEKMRALCQGFGAPETAETDIPADSENENQPEATLQAAHTPEPESVPSERDFDCLPADLISLLRSADGRRVTASTCTPACLPAPKGMSKQDLAEYESRNGIHWCEDCVPVEGHLSLDDVRRIEEAAPITLCPTPPRQMPRMTGLDNGPGQGYTRVRGLYRSLPPVTGSDDAIALVIGNRDYDALPDNATAQNDAGAMYAFLTEHLGYRQDNVLDVRNATKAELERLFGTLSEPQGELWRRVEERPEARVVVYYAGHGGTNAEQTETYLLPTDAERYREERSGYPLSLLYTNLGQLEAQSVLVLLEADFGRDYGDYIFPPNVSETTARALPDGSGSKLTVFAASDRGQKTLVDSTYGIGLFTRYLIEGWAGRADKAPVGNEDGKVDSAEIYVYAALMVRMAARKSFGLLQTPAYSGSKTIVLSGGLPRQE
jgi:hypothetical protein